MSTKKQIIVMMGGPGVGKGTFSGMLMAHHTYKHIEAGAILRAMPADSQIGKLIAEGNLVPDKMVCDLMAKKFVDSDMILDGFPRTLRQAQWLVKNYADNYDIHVLYLNTDDNTLIERIQKRVHNGSNRSDDSAMQIIKRRLQNYHEITMPAIEWLRNAPGIKFSEIDATGDEQDNFRDISLALCL